MLRPGSYRSRIPGVRIDRPFPRDRTRVQFTALRLAEPTTNRLPTRLLHPDERVFARRASDAGLPFSPLWRNPPFQVGAWIDDLTGGKPSSPTMRRTRDPSALSANPPAYRWGRWSGRLTTCRLRRRDISEIFLLASKAVPSAARICRMPCSPSLLRRGPAARRGHGETSMGCQTQTSEFHYVAPVKLWCSASSSVFTRVHQSSSPVGTGHPSACEFSRGHRP